MATIGILSVLWFETKGEQGFWMLNPVWMPDARFQAARGACEKLAAAKGGAERAEACLEVARWASPSGLSLARLVDRGESDPAVVERYASRFADAVRELEDGPLVTV